MIPMNEPLSLDAFVSRTRPAALWPSDSRILSPVLGLVAEAGDAVDSIHPAERISAPVWKWRRELGGVLFNLVNTALDFGFSIHDITDLVTGGLRCETFEDLAFQRLSPRDRRRPMLKISVAIGKLAGVARNLHEAGYSWGQKIPLAHKAIVATSLAEILSALCELCELEGVTLNQVARIQLAKLTNSES